MAYTTINKPSSYFTPTLYTGTGSSQSITTVGFKPDWVWIKDRTSANNHREYDIIRGATVELYPNLTDGDTTQAQSLTSFNSNGFSLGNLAQVNTNGNNYVSWNWLAANSTTTNTSGSISSTVSVNTTSGFSIVSYTGSNSNTTVGHGLGVAPNMIIVKNRTSVTNYWATYHSSLGNGQLLRINATDASISAGYWNNTSPTSTVFSVQANNLEINQSGSNYIAYCFAQIKGYSAFGSFTGNGSTNGTFVYTGFKPAFFLVKGSSNTSDWIIFDNKRDPINVVGRLLLPNTSGSESNLIATHYPLDFVSNGFKMRTDQLTGTTSLNASGVTYIYAAFAENPFVSATAIPTTAR